MGIGGPPVLDTGANLPKHGGSASEARQFVKLLQEITAPLIVQPRTQVFDNKLVSRQRGSSSNDEFERKKRILDFKDGKPGSFRLVVLKKRD